MLTKPNTDPLLPRLRELRLGGDVNYDVFPWLQFSIRLLHDNLKKLYIYIPSDSPTVATYFLDEVSCRAPNVEKIDVWTTLETFPGVIADSMSKFFSTMQKLTRVDFTSLILTPALLSSLQRNPHLETIRVYSHYFSDDIMPG